MKRIGLFSLLLAIVAVPAFVSRIVPVSAKQNPNVRKPVAQQKPCCAITGINASKGQVTARVTASGQTFTFSVSASAVKGLKVGQGVFADFTTKQVSLDGNAIVGPMIGLGVLPSSASKGASTTTSKTTNAHAGGTSSTPSTAGSSPACKTPIAHSDGLGKQYYDCNPVGTYTAATAIEACAAATGNAALCAAGYNCPPTWDQDEFVCSNSAVPNCWGYKGSQSGEVTTQACPFTNVAKWQ